MYKYMNKNYRHTTANIQFNKFFNNVVNKSAKNYGDNTPPVVLLTLI